MINKLYVNYFITDHLGSTRVVINNNSVILGANDYYPFGKLWEGAAVQAPTTRYLFNGKEKQTTGNLNYMDYGARMYDDFTGRWFVQDPLQEKYYPFSSYSYCVNNPINAIDPDGRSVWGFLKGLGKGVLNSVKNTWNFVTSDAWKSSTWKGIGNLALGAALSVGNPNSTQALIAADNTLGTNTYEAVSNTKESIKNTVEKIASGNSEAIGEAIGDIAISATLTKGVSSIASKAEKLSGAAATAGKAAEGGSQLLLKSGAANLTQKGLDHIVARHGFTSGVKGVGKFAEGTAGTGLKSMINATTTQGVFRANTMGRAGTIAEYNFGKVIGTTSSGAPASSLRVVIGTNGNVITAFPF